MTYNQYSFDYVKKYFEDLGYNLLSTEYKTCKDNLLFEDNEKYRYYASFDRIKNKEGHSSNRFHPSNPWTIWNINHWADCNDISTKCVSNEYTGAKCRLKFKCSCGEIFYTTKDSFINSNKIKCDKCTGYNGNITFEEVKNNLMLNGYYLDISPKEFNGITVSDLYGHDKAGYKYKIGYNAAINGTKFEKVSKGNPFSIDNINKYLFDNNCQFECISNEYESDCSPLEFKCLNCGEIVVSRWDNINRNDNMSRNRIVCPKCGGRNESIHALVLKQIFMHEYPDTEVEEKSCVNPNTNRIMPTDIVNHKLKIAIEIQSQWHDYENIQIKDKIKKDYWINKGYNFYDPDIRDYTVLEMCQLFFPINEIPNYVDYNYANKLNIKEIQDLLNQGMNMVDIANKLNISTHRLYDAVHAGKIYYPDNYQRADQTPIIQFDLQWRKIAEYKTIQEAAVANNLKAGNISTAFRHNRNYSGGYYWMKKADYQNTTL